MRRTDLWLFVSVVWGISAALVGLIMLLVWLGVIHDLNCPPGSRQMSYMVGKSSVQVCAVRVPELGQ